jgi:hypothetical protein
VAVIEGATLQHAVESVLGRRAQEVKHDKLYPTPMAVSSTPQFACFWLLFGVFFNVPLFTGLEGSSNDP